MKEAFEKMTGMPDAWTNPALMVSRNAFIQGWEARAQHDVDATIIQYHEATIKRLEKRIEELAQPAQEPWCMKMNRCTTKCEDCPDEPVQEPDNGDELTIAYMSGVHRGKELAAQPAPVQPVAMDEVRELSDGFIENPEAIKYLLDCLRKAQGEDGLSQAHYNFICAFQRKGYAVLQRLNEDYGPEWTFSKHATTPQQRPWVGLTHQDISNEVISDEPDFVHGFVQGARWADALLEEKNNG